MIKRNRDVREDLLVPDDKYRKKNWKGTLISVAAIAISLIVVGGCLLGGYIGYKNYTKNHKKKSTAAQQETQLSGQIESVQQTKKETVVPTTAQPVTAVLGQLDALNAYGGGLVQYNSFYDNMGTYYASGWGGGASETDNGCDFSLNYNYQTFSGTVVLNSEFASSAKYSYSDRNHYDYVRLRIYGDGALLYTSPIVVWGMEPDFFNVDVSNVNILRLEINGKNFIRLTNDSLIKK